MRTEVTDLDISSKAYYQLQKNPKTYEHMCRETKQQPNFYRDTKEIEK